MSRREEWRSAGAIFVLALAVRTVAASGLRFPVSEYAAYYVAVARNLVDGHGLVSNALWSYQTPPLEVPRAAFEVWLPLPSLLAAVPMAVFGTTFAAAQAVTVVIGAIVPVLAWRLAADVALELGLPRGRARTLALGSGLAAAVLGPLVTYSALPDSTVPFAALALAACLLMTRISARPPVSAAVPGSAAVAGSRMLRTALADRRLLALGLILGLAALCRNEALWLGLTWLIVAWRWTEGSGRERAWLVVVPGAVAAAVFVPWAVRDWIAFGTPVPGQTIANALSVSSLDIFAYRDLPSLSRYLAEGPATLLRMRVDGTLHNLVDVLLVPALPTGPIGLLALLWACRLRSLRPLALFAALTFVVTCIVFPVATLWGTFLHAAGGIHVLLLVCCMVALDRVIEWVGRRRSWTRPVAWLGPAFVTATAVPLLVLSMATLDSLATDIDARYAALRDALPAAATAQDAGPLIADHPIWLADATGKPTLALPDESPASVVALARQFGAHVVVVESDGERRWPAAVADGSPMSGCFRQLALPLSTLDSSVNRGAAEDPLAHTIIYQVVC